MNEQLFQIGLIWPPVTGANVRSISLPQRFRMISLPERQRYGVSRSEKRPDLRQARGWDWMSTLYPLNRKDD